MTKKLSIAALIAVVLLAVLGWWFWQRKPQEGPPRFHGTVDIRQVSLAFDGNDRVLEMNVEEGDTVKAGQALARLDTRTARLQLRQSQAQVAMVEQALLALRHGSRPEEIGRARAQLSATEAEVERARLQLGRLEQTSASTGGRAVSAQDLDNARAQLRAALAQRDAQQQAERLTQTGPRQEDIARTEAQLEGAKAEVALLQHRIDLAELRAPQDAVVRARLLEPGDMASPQRPAYTLALTSPKWVRIYVAEPQLGWIRPGMVAEVTTDSAPGRPIQGRVGYISSVAEFTPKTVQTEELRTALVYEVRVLVQDPDNTLRLGMPATVTIDSGQASQGAAKGASAPASKAS